MFAFTRGGMVFNILNKFMLVMISVIWIHHKSLAQKNCTQIQGIILGNGHNIRELDTTSAGDCCDACNKEAHCLAWTFITSSGVCYLHDLTSPHVNATDHISGERSVPVPPFIPKPNVLCSEEPFKTFAYCDYTLPIDQRVNDLIDRMTLAEKVGQTSTIAPAIPHLGMLDYNWRSNCVHGWTNGPNHWPTKTYWTVFPNPSGMGATWDIDIIKKMGQVTADEGRALHNIALSKWNGSSLEAAGLNCFSPNVNLYRDPRWGRNEETFGEDTFHMGQCGLAYTVGLQEGEDKKYLKIAACAKHYAVHDGPDNTRSTFIANVTTHDLYDTFLPAFEAQARAGQLAQVMPAYSSVGMLDGPGHPSGAPDAANDYLLRTILREEFNRPNISVCSDNGGVAMVHRTHHWVDSDEKAAAVCMNAGTDLDLGHDDIYSKNLLSAVKNKETTETAITAAVWRSMFWRMKLGDFDPIERVPYQNIGPEVLDTVENQNTNLQAARESLVLLKNVDKTLPINRKTLKKLVVVGPNANNGRAYLSNYAGIPSKIITIAQGINATLQSSAPKATLKVVSGCTDVKCENSSLIQGAVDAANGADYAICVVGLDSSIEGEGHDRLTTPCDGIATDIFGVPGCQQQLIDKISQVAKRTVIVLVHGNGIAMKKSLNDSSVGAILDTFYPGALGGAAVADGLFGDYTPGGKLPFTIYDPDASLPSLSDYDMTKSPGRTYRYYTGHPLMPFGYGLVGYSSTSLDYSKLTLSDTSIDPCHPIFVEVTIINHTPYITDEVVQIYIKPPSPTANYVVPLKQLVGFKRVHQLLIGEEKRISFTLDAFSLSVTDTLGVRQVNAGQYTVYVGGQQPTKKSIGVLSAEFTVKLSSKAKDCNTKRKCYSC